MDKPYFRIIAVLFLVCLLTYAGSLKNEFMIDDYKFVDGQFRHTFQTPIDYFTQVPAQHYSPFYYLLNTALFRVLGNNASALRLANVFLFFLSCLCVYAALLLLTKNTKAAFLAALFFAVHPINTVVVNHITAGFNMLYLIFSLCSLMTFDLSFEKSPRQSLCRALSFLFFVMSLLCFEGAILLAVYMVYVAHFLKGRSLKQAFKKCAPYFSISLAYCILWLSLAGPNTSLPEKIAAFQLTPLSYIASLLFLFKWYVVKLFLPEGTVLIYNMLPVRTFLWLWTFLFSALLGACGWFILRYRKTDNKAFGLCWFLTGFILAVPAVFTHSYMGLVMEPHWLFLSSIGFFFLTAVFLYELKSRLRRLLWVFLLSAIFIFLFAHTQKINLAGRTAKSFAQYWLRSSPDNAIALMSLAKTYGDAGKYGPALLCYQQVLDKSRYAPHKVYANMASVFIAQNKFADAREMIKNVLSTGLDDARGYSLLGDLHLKEGDLKGAEENLLRAIALDPYDIHARLKLADLYQKNARFKEAAQQLSEILKTEPSLKERKGLLARLAALYIKQNDPEKAYDIISSLLKSDNSAEAFLLLGYEFDAQGLSAIAVNLLKEGLKLYPREKELYLFYGVLLANQQNLKEAIAVWQQGQKLAPYDERFRRYISQAQAIKIKKN